MGIEINTIIDDACIHTAAAAPLILGLQPSALVDHVATVDSSLLSRIPGEPGGSFPVAAETVANTIRGLAAGFGISCGIIGACGDDEQGRLFIDNIDLSRLRHKIGHTAQCVCLVDEMANRTMRPCLSTALKVQGDDLTTSDLRGSKWVVMRYGIFNMEVIQTAIKIAKQEGVSVGQL